MATTIEYRMLFFVLQSHYLCEVWVGEVCEMNVYVIYVSEWKQVLGAGGGLGALHGPAGFRL